MKIDVVKLDAGKAGSIDLDDAIFGIEEIRSDILQRAVKWQLSRRQAGTHKTKERGEIAGSTRKLYRQKGTGMARSGSIKSPLRRSGGTTFGPRPRNYSLRLTKKTRQLARRSALSCGSE